MIVKVLACCRRVVVLLCLLVTVTFAWFWWSLPDLNRLQPEIQAELQQRLGLQALQLGALAWRWRGDMEIVADDVNFNAHGGQVQMRHAQLSLRVSLVTIMRRSWLPENLSIRDGNLQLRFANADLNSSSDGTLASPFHFPPLSVKFDNMTVGVHWRGQTLLLHHMQGTVSPGQRSAKIEANELSFLVMLDPDGEINNARLNIHDIDWLTRHTKAISLSNTAALSLTVRRKKTGQWRCTSRLAGDAVMLNIPAIPFRLPFDELTAEAVINGASLFKFSTWKHVYFPALGWQSGDSNIQANARWHKRVLKLHANSSFLAMPILWNWLQGLDELPEWRQWLSRMHQGTAYNVQADITLPWATPWKALPSSLAEDVFLYHVTGLVRDADIDLGSEGEVLHHAKVDVDLNQFGLNADIYSAQLPHKIGSASGQLYIPWNTLMLHIQAQSQKVDMSRLHHWINEAGAKKLGWHGGSGKGSVHLLWDPLKPEPDKASATIYPVEPWQLNLQGEHVSVNQGRVEWDLLNGILAHDLQVSGELFDATLNFDAYSNKDQWALRAFQGSFASPLANLVDTFHIPLSHPSGMFRAEMNWSSDDRWHGTVILDHAAWRNFLGESKKEGQPMKLRFQAKMPTFQHIHVDHLQCDDAGYLLSGNGVWDLDQLIVNLPEIETRGFRGAIKIVAPSGLKPWRMNIQAAYLQRTALPDALVKNSNQVSTMDKNWHLVANIDRFDWKDAKMQDVSLNMRSNQGSGARFTASHIDTGHLHIQDVRANFSLPGGGRVKIDQLNGLVNEQQLTMAAMLTPQTDGAMRWQGFATTEGNFSRIMRSSMESLFDGGTAQILLAGEGLLMRDQPWWDGLRGRLRMRVDEGSIAKGGVLTKILAITSLADLPALLIGQRKDLTHAGLYYKRFQIEATIADQDINIRQLAMRSTAMDMAGYGHYNLEKSEVDVLMVFRPLQNLDAILGKIPLLRDLVGGAAHSLIRKVYHMHGTVADAQIDQVTPSSAGLASPGLVEGLLTLPDRWFGEMKTKE